MINNRYGKYRYFTNETEPLTQTPEKTDDEYEIPLPNEVEICTKPIERHQKQNSSFFSDLFKNIQMEEIILLGLLFLFIAEGVEDEVLILLLLYVLFWEKFFN